MSRLSVLFLVFVLVVPSSWSQADLAVLERELRITNQKLEPHLEFSLDEDPGAPELLERKWQIFAEWIAAWLDSHPNATAKNVESAFAVLDKNLGASVVLLERSTYLCAVRDEEVGTAFIVGDDPTNTGTANYKVRWTIRDASPDFSKELSSWTALSARGSCKENNRNDCGPLFADAASLPQAADGHPRFYLDAEYAQGAGATVGKQLSIWQWDGHQPKPLILKSFAFMIDQAQGTKLKGNILHVGEKGFFHSFFSCGSCEERQLDWRIRITPTGFIDFGERSLVPELDALDDVVTRLAHNQAATDLASEQVIEFLQEIVDDQREEIATYSDDKDYFTLGMIMETKVTREGGDTILCFSTDNIGSLRFRMQPRNDGFFIQRVEDLGDQSNVCGSVPLGAAPPVPLNR